MSLRERLTALWEYRVRLAVVVPLLIAALAPEALRHLTAQKRIFGGSSAASSKELGIKDLVQEVRAELAAVEKEMQDRNEAALFELTAFEMELNFVVTAHSTDTAGVKTELVTVDSEVQAGSEKVQRLTLHWNAAKPHEFETDSSGAVPSDAINLTPPPAHKGAKR